MSVFSIEIEALRSGSRHVAGQFKPAELEFDDSQEFRFEGEARLDVRLNSADQLTFFVAGQVHYRFSAECRRCLKSFEGERSAEVRGVYAFGEGLENLDLDEEERDIEGIIPLSQDQKNIDLGGLIRETLVLDYPRYLVCSENCKGLCPGCGADLNEESCNCSASSQDPRWAKLRELKKKVK
jgi:uncharacterized protein